MRGRPTDPYGALLRSIVGQQLSTKAARSIYGRLTDQFGGRAPTPQELLDADPEVVRSPGCRGQGELPALARRARALGELELDRLRELSDEESRAR